MKIGVFDSGIGGQAVANAIKDALPGLDIVVREDREHVPYGLRPPGEILGFVVPIFESMVAEGCQAIVVACNTVSTTLLDELRERFRIPLIGVEPMVKPAAGMSKTKIIAVCATPTTLASQRYLWLKQNYAQGIEVLEPDCSDWALMIERKQIDEARIAERINQVLGQGADVIVLGCTHYHWIEEEIKALAAGKAEVLQPEPLIVAELKQVLGQL